MFQGGEAEDMRIEEAVKQAKSYGEVMVLLGYKSRGGNTYQKLRKQICELGCDTSHFESAQYDEDDIFIENSSYKNMTRLKKKILKNGLLPYRCSVCGNPGMWNGKELVLQLHHKNGKNNDHRISNLMFLCPNCHSQTENYGSKNH